MLPPNINVNSGSPDFNASMIVMVISVTHVEAITPLDTLGSTETFMADFFTNAICASGSSLLAITTRATRSSCRQISIRRTFFCFPHGTTFPHRQIRKSTARRLPPAVVCRATAEPLRCARRSKIRMLLRNRIENAALLRSDGVGPPIPFAIAVQAPRGGARGFFIIRNSGAVCCAARRLTSFSETLDP